MAEPISFTTSTPRFELPLLFAGQAQKEFFYNEAQMIIDALLHLSVDGLEPTPPADPSEGQCWIIDAGATSVWAGKEDAIAIWHSNDWKFAGPQIGMRAFNRAMGQVLHFNGGWNLAQTPTLPTGGNTIDSEARSAIESLVGSLRSIGVFPEV